MNVEEKRALSIEAKLQLDAIKRIGIWKKICMVFSTLGLAMIYAAFAGTKTYLMLGIVGVLMMVFCICAASVFNIGMKNGKRNVEKMLYVLEKGNGYEI